MQDIFPAAERILSDVENIFKKSPELQTFEIIPVEDNKNKSPVFYDGNSLGLASWCIQPLYCYVYNRLMNLRQNPNRREDPALLLRWLLGALLLNPDVSTFWNMRRDFVRNRRIDLLEELRFVNIVLFFKAKCFEAFSYRRWILKLLLLENTESLCNIERLFRREIQVASMAANRYGNNCHAWSHRECIISMFESFITNRVDILLNDEWEESTKWCNYHVSDYSGFVYRQFLMKRLLLREGVSTQQKTSSEMLLKRREIVFDFVKSVTRGCTDVFLLKDGTSKEVLDILHGADTAKIAESQYEQTLLNLSYWVEDCVINEDLIKNFPGHEALWYHRRFLLYSLLALNESYKNCLFYKIENSNFLQTRKINNDKIKDLNFTLRTSSVSQSLLEIAFCSRNKNLIDTAKRNGNYQNNLAEKFVNYLIGLKLES